jgi:tetratricopeptide (TPR) repeat protein
VKNFLALYIDTDFLVGTVCADEGNVSSSIKSGNDDFFWLYFYNDPFSNNISFGKDNQKHCNQGETNYIGNFIELLENENNTFQVGTYEFPIIELLRFSKILEKLKTSFSSQTYESQDNIPTLLTFSLSINELAKKTIVDYLNKQGFSIISYTIPLAELACKNAIMSNNINFANGNVVIFLEATNTNLHLAKLIFSSDYFLLDGEPEFKQGLGIDPRRRALLKHIVNKIGTMGILSENEKEIEYKLMEPKTIDWLNDLDMHTNNAPFPIVESLSKMPNQKRRVLVYKNQISEFTQIDIKLIINTYKYYADNNVLQEVSAIVLLGNLFQNEIIKNKFQSIISKEKLIVYSNRDIHNILSVYPKIDFNRYISEQGRIEAKAAADKQKKAEELAKEAAKVKAEKEAKDKEAADFKKENDRQKARELYEQAVRLEKEESLDLALNKVKDANTLDPERIEYSRFIDTLNTKIKEHYDKIEKYKSWYTDAESYEQSGEVILALKAFKNAQEIFDSAELRKKIVKIERDIEKQANESKVNGIIEIALALADEGKFEDAITNVNKSLEIDPANKTAKETLKKILILQINKKNEKRYKAIIAEADKYFKESSLDEALEKYNEALLLKPGDNYCKQQIAEIINLIDQKENQKKCEKIIIEADKMLKSDRWEEAKVQYEIALKLWPQNVSIKDKLKQCVDKIKAKEDAYNDLLFEATIAEKKGKLREAIDKLEKASVINPDNADVKRRIKNIKFNLEFESRSNIKSDTNQKTKINDDFFESIAKSKNTTSKESDNGFLNIKSQKKANDDDFFIAKKPPKNIIDDDDFLGLNKKAKN